MSQSINKVSSILIATIFIFNSLCYGQAFNGHPESDFSGVIGVSAEDNSSSDVASGSRIPTLDSSVPTAAVTDALIKSAIHKAIGDDNEIRFQYVVVPFENEYMIINKMNDTYVITALDKIEEYDFNDIDALAGWTESSNQYVEDDFEFSVSGDVYLYNQDENNICHTAKFTPIVLRNNNGCFAGSIMDMGHGMIMTNLMHFNNDGEKVSEIIQHYTNDNGEYWTYHKRYNVLNKDGESSNFVDIYCSEGSSAFDLLKFTDTTESLIELLDDSSFISAISAVLPEDMESIVPGLIANEKTVLDREGNPIFEHNDDGNFWKLNGDSFARDSEVVLANGEVRALKESLIDGRRVKVLIEPLTEEGAENPVYLSLELEENNGFLTLGAYIGVGGIATLSDSQGFQFILDIGLKDLDEDFINSIDIEDDNSLVEIREQVLSLIKDGISVKGISLSALRKDIVEAGMEYEQGYCSTTLSFQEGNINSTEYQLPSINLGDIDSIISFTNEIFSEANITTLYSAANLRPFTFDDQNIYLKRGSYYDRFTQANGLEVVNSASSGDETKVITPFKTHYLNEDSAKSFRVEVGCYSQATFEDPSGEAPNPYTMVVRTISVYDHNDNLIKDVLDFFVFTGSDLDLDLLEIRDYLIKGEVNGVPYEMKYDSPEDFLLAIEEDAQNVNSPYLIDGYVHQGYTLSYTEDEVSIIERYSGQGELQDRTEIETREDLQIITSKNTDGNIVWIKYYAPDNSGNSVLQTTVYGTGFHPSLLADIPFLHTTESTVQHQSQIAFSSPRINPMDAVSSSFEDIPIPINSIGAIVFHNGEFYSLNSDISLIKDNIIDVAGNFVLDERFTLIDLDQPEQSFRIDDMRDDQNITANISVANVKDVFNWLEAGSVDDILIGDNVRAVVLEKDNDVIYGMFYHEKIKNYTGMAYFIYDTATETLQLWESYDEYRASFSKTDDGSISCELFRTRYGDVYINSDESNLLDIFKHDYDNNQTQSNVQQQYIMKSMDRGLMQTISEQWLSLVGKTAFYLPEFRDHTFCYQVSKVTSVSASGTSLGDGSVVTAWIPVDPDYLPSGDIKDIQSDQEYFDYLMDSSDKSGDIVRLQGDFKVTYGTIITTIAIVTTVVNDLWMLAKATTAAAKLAGGSVSATSPALKSFVMDSFYSTGRNVISRSLSVGAKILSKTKIGNAVVKVGSAIRNVFHTLPTQALSRVFSPTSIVGQMVQGVLMPIIEPAMFIANTARLMSFSVLLQLGMGGIKNIRHLSADDALAAVFGQASMSGVYSYAFGAVLPGVIWSAGKIPYAGDMIQEWFKFMGQLTPQMADPTIAFKAYGQYIWVFALTEGLLEEGAYPYLLLNPLFNGLIDFLESGVSDASSMVHANHLRRTMDFWVETLSETIGAG